MKPPVIAMVKVVPLGTATPSVSKYVSACLDEVRAAKDITFQITGMGTILQGPMERILEIVQKMHEVPFSMGAQRVSTTINIDDRRDKPTSIEHKVKAVS